MKHNLRSSLFEVSLPVLSLGILLTSCGGSRGSGSVMSEPFTQRDVPQVFTAKLEGMNKTYVPGGTQAGVATLTIDGDTIRVKMLAADLHPNMIHMAHIHKGVKCPDAVADDLNKDGVVDVLEGLPAYGFILVNFGADLSSLEASLKEGAPTADDTGHIEYSGQGVYSDMVADLHDRPEMDPATGIGKLPSAENFKPEEAVIVVHGVAESTALPPTTGSLKDMTPQMTLPVLCGPLEVAVTPAQ